MVELLLTFPAEVKEDMGKYLEKQRLDIARAAKSRPNQMLSGLYKRAFGADVFVQYQWKFLSDTTAKVEFVSNVKLDAETLRKGVQSRFLDNVKVEILPEAPKNG